MIYDYTKELRPVPCGGYGCAHCGRSLKRGDLHLDCPDCAAIFCEACVKDGTFGSHDCEDYAWDDEEAEEE